MSGAFLPSTQISLEPVIELTASAHLTVKIISGNDCSSAKRDVGIFFYPVCCACKTGHRRFAET